MQARIRKAMKNEESGFTLIELLVVMLIIGILSAIAIPVFMSQQAKARDTAAKSDVSNLAKYVATYYVDGTGELNLVKDANGLVALNDTANPANKVGEVRLSDKSSEVTGSDINSATDWCVNVQGPDYNSNASTVDHVFKYTQSGGLQKGACGV